MYDTQSNLIIDFHGTDKASAKALVDIPIISKAVRSHGIGLVTVFISGRIISKGHGDGLKTGRNERNYRRKMLLWLELLSSLSFARKVLPLINQIMRNSR